MEIKYLESGFEDVFNRMVFGEKDDNGNIIQRGMPEGHFWDKRFTVVPYTSGPTSIVVEPVRPFHPLKVYVTQPVARKAGGTANRIAVTVVPTTDRAVVNVTLGRGHNLITANDGLQEASAILNATNYAMLITAYASELKKYVWSRIERQEEQIFNDYTTSLVEPLIRFPELLPPVKSLNRMATRFVARAMASESMSDKAVEDLLTALTANTPYLKNAQNTKQVDAAIYTIYTAQEDFAGVDAHIWLPRVNVSRWLAFSKLVNNMKSRFSLQSVSEHQVSFVDLESNETQTHRFDFDLSEDTLTSPQYYPQDYNVVLYIKTKSTIKMAMASYEFDLYVNEKNPLGGNYRLHFDLGIPLDDARSFDSDPVDLFSDGFVGFRLTGRMEQDHPPVWDTADAEFGVDSLFKTPADSYAGDPWVYMNGYYTQELFVQRVDQQIDVPLDCTGEVTGGTPSP